MATKQEPIRRTDVVRCETCGEDYSITYKRCPFCDERPGRSPRAGAGGGRRVSGGANPLQVFILLLSVVLIIAALFIVFTTVAPLLSRKEPTPQQPDQQPSISQPVQTEPSTPGSTDEPGTDTPSVEEPGTETPGTDLPVTPDVPTVSDPVIVTKVNSLSLNKTDFTLAANETFAFKANVDPADTKITWSSSNESAATVSADGVVANVNTGAHQVKVTITATAGDKTATCTVYCRGGSSGNAGSTPTAPTIPSTPSIPSTPAVPNTPSTPSSSTSQVNKSGKISGAGSGLNVRSGPGSSNEAIASLNNGTDITVLEDTGTGWYKISFSGMGGKSTTGYVSSKYVVLN